VSGTAAKQAIPEWFRWVNSFNRAIQRVGAKNEGKPAAAQQADPEHRFWWDETDR